jgi:hypothetical protein
MRFVLLAAFVLVSIASSAHAQLAGARAALRGSPPTAQPAPQPEPLASYQPPPITSWQPPVERAEPTRRYTSAPRRSWDGGADGFHAYRPYPYADGGTGYTLVPSLDRTSRRRDGLFEASVRVGYLLGEVGHLEVRASAVLGIFELYVRQRVMLEALAPNGVDALGVGHVGMGFRLARDEHLRLRARGGLAHAEDGIGGLFGGAFGLMLDWYFARPWALSIEGSVGIVGAAWLLECAASFAVIEGPIELHVGWDAVVIRGLAGGETFTFTGPFVMVRGWAS